MSVRVACGHMSCRQYQVTGWQTATGIAIPIAISATLGGALTLDTPSRSREKLTGIVLANCGRLSESVCWRTLLRFAAAAAAKPPGIAVLPTYR